MNISPIIKKNKKDEIEVVRKNGKIIIGSIDGKSKSAIELEEKKEEIGYFVGEENDEGLTLTYVDAPVPEDLQQKQK